MSPGYVFKAAGRAGNTGTETDEIFSLLDCPGVSVARLPGPASILANHWCHVARHRPFPEPAKPGDEFDPNSVVRP